MDPSGNNLNNNNNLNSNHNRSQEDIGFSTSTYFKDLSAANKNRPEFTSTGCNFNNNVVPSIMMIGDKN